MTDNAATEILAERVPAHFASSTVGFASEDLVLTLVQAPYLSAHAIFSCWTCTRRLRALLSSRWCQPNLLWIEIFI